MERNPTQIWLYGKDTGPGIAHMIKDARAALQP